MKFGATLRPDNDQAETLSSLSSIRFSASSILSSIGRTPIIAATRYERREQSSLLWLSKAPLTVA